MTNTSTLRTAVRMLASGAAAIGIVVSAGIGTAGALTHDQMTPSATTSLAASVGDASSTGEICTDWTNEDGSHGTNCPYGGHRIDVSAAFFLSPID